MIGRSTLISALLALPFVAAGVAHGRGEETLLDFRMPVSDPLPTGFFPTMSKPIDLDGDGFVDLVVAGRDPDDRLVTMTGLGTGRFTLRQTLQADGFVDWLDVADIDGDEVVDIVAAWRGGAGKLVVYRGLGAGAFDAPAELLPLGRDPQGLALGDFDGDGDVDVAISLYIGSAVEVLSNDGTGAFERTSFVRLGQFFGGFVYPRLVQAGDIDGDGDLDLVANEIGGGRLAVLRNEGGRFGRAREYRAPVIAGERPGIAALQLVDLDGDGDLDIGCPVILLYATQKYLGLVNDGAGGFDASVVGEGSPQGYAFEVEFADFDGDGDIDAASGVALPGAIVVSRRLNDVAFDFEPDELLFFGSLVRHLVAVDVDNDCDLDLVGVEGPGQAVFTSINRTQPKGCGGGVASTDGDGEAVADAKPKPGPKPARGPAPEVDRDHDGVFGASDVAAWLAERSQPDRAKPQAAEGKR